MPHTWNDLFVTVIDHSKAGVLVWSHIAFNESLAEGEIQILHILLIKFDDGAVVASINLALAEAAQVAVGIAS